MACLHTMSCLLSLTLSNTVGMSIEMHALTMFRCEIERNIVECVLYSDIMTLLLTTIHFGAAYNR